MKKIQSCFLLVVLLSLFYSCSASADIPHKLPEKEKSLRVVATLFPQYDFARTIGGDRAKVTLLLPPGAESHSFQPRPSDMIAIQSCDLFIYTGEHMEFWAEDLLESLPQSVPEGHKVQVLDVSKGISLLENQGEEAEEKGGHFQDYDPHIWTSPVNAMIMVEDIRDAFVEEDPENAHYYAQNAQHLLEELAALDQRFREITDRGKRKEIYFGGRFALHYFAKEYELTPISAYSNTSSESEPSILDITNMISRMERKKIPVIYYEELTEPKVARTIAQETGAEMLLFHGVHNVSKKDFQAGVTYVELMESNADHLERGLE